MVLAVASVLLVTLLCWCAVSAEVRRRLKEGVRCLRQHRREVRRRLRLDREDAPASRLLPPPQVLTAAELEAETEARRQAAERRALFASEEARARRRSERRPRCLAARTR